MLKKQEVKLYLGTVVLIELLGALGAFVSPGFSHGPPHRKTAPPR